MTLLAFCRVFGVAVFPILATAHEPSVCQGLSLLQLEVRRHVGLEQIPCVIHQTWKTHTLDSNQEDFVKSWTSKNPECQHKLWNDAELLIYDHIVCSMLFSSRNNGSNVMLCWFVVQTVSPERPNCNLSKRASHCLADSSLT